jgi:2-polyprenyl-6-hydroxyphenyl methylase/3-demethylubiquinone-9 3-methyltransferase
LASLKPSRVFDLGCGNGYIANVLAGNGFDVTGVDPSQEGIAAANQHFPTLKLYRASADDDLPARFGRFPAVISIEVVEHVYDPRGYASAIYDLVEHGGVAVISTPYHGYLKNLAIAALNKWDAHHDPLWAHGHIKFWSIATLTKLLEGAGFRQVSFRRVGRIPSLAKSMIAIATK